jgi:hypothetical protein
LPSTRSGRNRVRPKAKTEEKTPAAANENRVQAFEDKRFREIEHFAGSKDFKDMKPPRQAFSFLSRELPFVLATFGLVNETKVA